MFLNIAISIAVLKFCNTCHSQQSSADQLTFSQLGNTTTTTATELIISYAKKVPFAVHLTHLCSTRHRPLLLGVVIKRKRVTYNHTGYLNKHTVVYEHTNHILHNLRVENGLDAVLRNLTLA
jgi:hypothetical protein